MVSLLSRSSLRFLGRHPWQSFLTVLGVALGVAVVVAVDLAVASSRRAFDLSTDAAVGRTTDWIVGGPGGLPETVYTDLRVQAGWTDIAPVVEGYGVVPAPERRAAPDAAAALDADPVLQGTGREPGSTVLRLLGIDPLADTGFRPFLATDQSDRYRRADTIGSRAAGDAGFPLMELLVTRDSVVLAAPTATRLGLQPGDRFPLRVEGRRHTVLLIGVIEPADDRTREALDGLLIADIATTQDWLALTGRLSRIDVILPDTPVGDAARARLRERIAVSGGPAARLQPSAARGDSIREMTAAFELNLAALSLLALVCGMFLIYNAMTFSVIQRRNLIGTLRALGVTRAQIFTLIFREAVAVAIAGSLLGLLLGWVLGAGLVRLVVQTVNDLYFTVEVSRLALPPLAFLKALGLGLGATALAALPPAFEATRGPARAAMARSHIESRWRRLTPRAAAWGLALGLAGGLLMAVSGANLVLNFGALLLVILGCALLTPLMILLSMALIRPLLGLLFGWLGRMAARGVTTTLSRTAVAIAALMVAVSVTVAVGVMIASFRLTVDRWLERTLIADVYITTPKITASRIEGALDPSLPDRLAALPGVAFVNLYRAVDVDSPVGPVALAAFRLDPRSYRAFTFRATDEPAAWRAFEQDGALLVTETFAYRHALTVGSSLTLTTDRGPRDFSVAGIVLDYSSDRGGVLLSRSHYLRHWDDPAINSIGLYGEPSADKAQLLRAARAATHALDGPDQEILMQSNAAVRELSMNIFDRTFLVTDILRFVAMAVAFVGILSSLMALQLERSRELGILRATGLTPGQLWRLILTQTGLMGATAGALALPVGLLLAGLMIHVINRRSFGWTMDLQIDPGLLVQAVAAALVAALLAGLYPAWKMSRVPPAAALREE